MDSSDTLSAFVSSAAFGGGSFFPPFLPVFMIVALVLTALVGSYVIYRDRG